MKWFFILSFLLNAKEPQTKNDYLRLIGKNCMHWSLKEMVTDKATLFCRCYEKNLQEVTLEEAKHLWLDRAGDKKKSSLDKDQAQVIEYFDLTIAEECKKDSSWRKNLKK